MRKSGNNTNGGTSATVLQTGTDGVTATGHTTIISSLTANWTSAIVGQGVGTTTAVRLITSVAASVSLAAVTTNNTTAITSSALFTASMVGQIISGTNFNANTVITAVTDSSHATLSGNAFGSGTNAATLGAALTTTGVIAFSAASGVTWTIGGAWLTVQSSLPSASPVAAGDSIYIGAGIYREVVNIGISGSAGLPINVIGDVQGTVTGDTGEVQITNFLVNDKTAPASSTATIALGTHTFLSFSLITHVGSFACVSNAAGSHDVTWTDCTFLNSSSGGSLFSFTDPGGGGAYNYTFDRCSILSLATVGMSFSGTPYAGTHDVDLNIMIRNCFVFCPGATANQAIRLTPGTANTAKVGGMRIYNSTVIGLGIGIAGTPTGASSVTIPIEVHGCIIFGSITSPTGPPAGASYILESYNYICGNPGRTNVAAGPGSVTSNQFTNGSYALLLDIGQAFKVSGVARPFLSPSSPLSPMLAFGQSNNNVLSQNVGGPPMSVLSAPGWHTPPRTPMWRPGIPNLSSGISNVLPVFNYDWANRPRPAGGGSNLSAAGYLEYHDSALQDTITYNISPASAKLIGAADIDLLIPVDAVSNTFSVYCLYDINYGPQNGYPTFTLLADGEIGLVSQTVSAPGGAWGTWQQLTLQAFTPTNTGFVKIRLASLDSSGISQVNFDTFASS